MFKEESLCGSRQIETGFGSEPRSPSIQGSGPKQERGNSVTGETEQLDDDGRPKRTGNLWTGSAHVITAVIGSGVLSLAWAIAQMGWIAGPMVLLSFAVITWYTAILLCDAYRFGDPVTGRRLKTYMECVQAYLGPKNVLFCGIVQYSNLFGTAIGYTITASTSMVAIKRSNCFYKEGEDAACHVSNNLYMAIFGISQILFSQIPDFDQIWWLSIVAAVMSFSYASIGIGLSVGKASEAGHSHGSLTGLGTGHYAGQVTEAQKIWNILNSLGDIAFAYGFSNILMNIQDTLKSPPAEIKTMRKVTTIGIATTTFFYLTVGVCGYAAFGDNAPGNLLTGFGFYKPYWLVDLANAAIVVHLVGGYQVFSQPIFSFVEGLLKERFPKNTFVNYERRVRIPGLGDIYLNPLRLIWRTCFVLVTTIIALLLPFFNDIMGLLGAIGFYPLGVYFPVQIYIKRTVIKRWSRKWIWLQTLSYFCLIVSVAAAAGAVQGISMDTKHFKPFQ